MGLTVEIQFIVVEWLDGDNKSKCDGDSTISIKIKAAGGGRKQGFHNWLHCLKEKNSYMIPVTARFADVFALCFQASMPLLRVRSQGEKVQKKMERMLK